MSPLFLFGRQQDFAYQQEVDGNPAQRHHVRFWRCPDGWLLPGGIRVDWLAAGTFDTAVGLSLFTLQVTHRIDADTDIERDHIIATLTAAHPRMAVTVVADFSTGYHARNGGGDSIRTDGDLPIVDVRAVAGVAAGATHCGGDVTDRTSDPRTSRARELLEAASQDDPACRARSPRWRERPRAAAGGGRRALARVSSALGMPVLATSSDNVGRWPPSPPTSSRRPWRSWSSSSGVARCCRRRLLAIFIYRGHNWPRVIVMVFSALSISASFLQWWADDQEIRIGTTLLTLGAGHPRPPRALQPGCRGLRPPQRGR